MAEQIQKIQNYLNKNNSNRATYIRKKKYSEPGTLRYEMFKQAEVSSGTPECIIFRPALQKIVNEHKNSPFPLNFINNCLQGVPNWNEQNKLALTDGQIEIFNFIS